MSTEALNKIIKEVNALTPQERRELFDRLAHEEQNSEEHIERNSGTFDSVLSNLSVRDEGITAHAATLREWLNEARNMRAELPLTSDSVDILRELREVRSSR